ncbi:hypothetical protein CMO88_00150 [Candidatus Woesearchaeota archaeon]|nr:hypothetical protein [Candidatus Woesearchaeota archaeon]|tara:strand:- start:2101 stop:2610 length:510 start_codon:yes stop_codon:yes gene_type:complete
MLKLIKDLTPFFEDCYRRINVREYAKIMSISPPTASKLLAFYVTEDILLSERYRNYILFYADKESKDLIALSRIYWAYRLKELLDFMESKLNSPTIILFGSLSKAEAKMDSDADLVIFSHKKVLNLENFEKKLKRKIQLFWFKSLKDVQDSNLTNSIINGYVLRGRLSF